MIPVPYEVRVARHLLADQDPIIESRTFWHLGEVINHRQALWRALSHAAGIVWW